MTPLRYLDFQVRLLPYGQAGARAMVVHAAAGGGGSATLDLPRTPLDLERILHALACRPRDPETAEDPRIPNAESVGRLLSDQLFQKRIRDAFIKSRSLARSSGQLGLRLQLLFDLEDEAGPEDPAKSFRQRSLALAALPWELMHDPESGRPLARSRETPVSRVLGVRAAAPRPPLELPLRILVVGASPRDVPELDVLGEMASVVSKLRGRPGIDVDELPEVSLAKLRERLSRRDVHVVHFIGHGEFDRQGVGSLVFEDPDREADRVPGKIFTELLLGRPALRLVVFNACRGAQLARREGQDPFAGVATALLEGGIPAVVAMQLPITDLAACAFSGGFYDALAGGQGLDQAVAEGRQEILTADRESREWATPVLYLPQGADAVLPSLAGVVDVPQEIRSEIRGDAPYLDAKTEGFVGREWLAESLEEFLRAERSGYFFVLGDPGIGKSAVMAHWVRRRRCLYHFNRRAEGVVRAESFLRNVCAQLILERRLSHRSLPTRADRDGGFLVELLHEATRGLRPDERLIVAVDALDESDTDSLPWGTNALYLPQHLPTGVFFVVSSRLEDVLPKVDAPSRRQRLRHDSAENLTDIRELVGNHLGLPGIVGFRAEQALDEDAFVELMAEKSEGNFMYLHHVLPAIERGELRVQDASQIPSGLDGYYDQHWQRLRLRDEKAWLHVGLPVLYVVTAVGGAVSAELIDDLLGHPGLVEVKSVLRAWKPFLHTSQALAEDGSPVVEYSLYHTSFANFIQKKDEVQDQGLSLKAIRERLLYRLLDDDAVS